VAKELLEVKLNSDIIISNPLPEALFSKIRLIRELKLRQNSAADLLSILNLNTPSDSFQNIAKNAIIRQLTPPKGQQSSIIDSLLDFEITPSGIPSGYIEGQMKILCIGYLKIVGNTNQLKKSPLFQLLLKSYENINNKSFQAAYDLFESLIQKNKNLVKKLHNTIDTQEFKGDIFKLCYYYFTLKKVIISNNGDIKAIIKEIENERISKLEMTQAIYLLGVSLSYSVLFESIQKLKLAPLFGNKKTRSIVQYRDENSPSIVEDEVKSIEEQKGVSKKNSPSITEDKVKSLKEQKGVSQENLPSLFPNDQEPLEEQNDVSKENSPAIAEDKVTPLEEQNDVSKENSPAIAEDEVTPLEEQNDVSKENSNAIAEDEVTPLEEQNDVNKENSTAIAEDKVTPLEEQNDVSKENPTAIAEDELTPLEEQNDVSKENPPSIAEDEVTPLEEQNDVSKENSTAIAEDKVTPLEEQNDINGENLPSVLEEEVKPLEEQKDISKSNKELRLNLIEKANKEIKTNRKQIIKFLKKFHSENKLFSYNELKEAIPEEYKKKNGELRKIAELLMDIFNDLKN
jgi:hypothetical protein